MRQSFLPSTDDGLLSWSSVFSRGINENPSGAGLTEAEAAHYATLHEDYAARLRVALAPATRTAISVLRKNESREALKAEARRLAGVVQHAAVVTNERRIALGLTVPKATRTRSARPAVEPYVRVLETDGRRLTVELLDKEHMSSRAKAPGAIGALIFSYAGATPPKVLSDWRFETSTSSRVVEVAFPLDVPPGTRVHVTAAWFNRRAELSPFAEPAGAWIQFGGSLRLARRAA